MNFDLTREVFRRLFIPMGTSALFRPKLVTSVTPLKKRDFRLLKWLSGFPLELIITPKNLNCSTFSRISPLTRTIGSTMLFESPNCIHLVFFCVNFDVVKITIVFYDGNALVEVI
jgi:hypothetical protein